MAGVRDIYITDSVQPNLKKMGNKLGSHGHNMNALVGQLLSYTRPIGCAICSGSGQGWPVTVHRLVSHAFGPHYHTW